MMLLVVEGPDQAERALVKVAAGEDPPWSEKNGVPWIFFGEGWAALTRGPECSASGAEERGVSFGRSLQQRSPPALEAPLSGARSRPPADPDG
jgi:hypothetical protein